MKHVLMIIPFFPPMGGGGVYRPLAFVRHLSEYGWTPTVIAPQGDAYWISDPSLLERVPSHVRVVRTRTWSAQSMLARRGPASQKRSTHGFGAARRAASALLVPDTYVGWYPFALRAALAVARAQKFQAVYSTSPPETAHLVGRMVHRRARLPWVADFRDPWMNLHLLPPASAVHARMHRRMERSVCRDARVVVTTRWHEKLLGETCPGARVTRISNGYDAEEARALAGHSPAPAPFRIVHAGMLTQTRSAVPFLEGMAAFLAAHPDARAAVRVDFYGPREDANERALAALGIGDCVHFHDTIAHTDALLAERTAHILLLIKHANPRYDGLVPGKLYEYIGLGRPILALAPPGEARELVERLRRGITAAPDARDEIASALATLFQRWRDGVLDAAFELGPVPEFDRARLAGDLARVLDEEASA